jgi:hypothetical protein
MFCLHCGARISSPSARVVTEWEYKDFVYKGWKPRDAWVSTSGSNSYTIPGARLYFWQYRQQAILAELQKWLDEGWEPVGEVGPSGIVLHQYRAIKREPLGWILMMLLYVGTFGLFLLFDLMSMDWWAEPTEFRVQMRRPKE